MSARIKSSAKKQGFTLIELMVVIAIIAVLTAIGFTSYQKAQIAARDSRRKSDLLALRTAIEVYYQKNGDFPPVGFNNGDSIGVWPANRGFCDEIRDTAGSPPQTQVANSLTSGGFINTLPQDPTYGSSSPLKDDYYYWLAGGSGGVNYYALFAVLENTSDPQVHPQIMLNATIPGAGVPAINMVTSCANGSTDYNYAVYSP